MEGSVVFYVNGRRRQIFAANPRMTLLEYLRSPDEHATGTKYSCGEGGCGACTVVLSRFSSGRTEHLAVNACLMPLCAVDGCAIITVEGLGNVDHLHPIQERIAKSHGSQCGFCTPGIVMALYAFLRTRPHATAREIEASLDGNLCRCTGYRPIIAAAASFGSDKRSKVSGRVCPSSGRPCDCGNVGEPFGKIHKSEAEYPTDLIFPPELKSYNRGYLHVQYHDKLSNQTVSWYRPDSLATALKLKSEIAGLRPIVGATEITVERSLKHVLPSNYLYLGDLPELMSIEVTQTGIKIGGSAPLTRVIDSLQILIRSLPEYQTRPFVAMREQLRFYGSNQIRNVACLAGNIATASPISDMLPTLWAVGARLWIQSAEDEEPYAVPFDSSCAPLETRLKQTDLIVSIEVPFTTENQYVMSYMQSRRKEDDIALVSAAFFVELEAKEPNAQVVSARSIHGGMAAWTKQAVKTQELLTGQPWNRSTLDAALKCLREDLPLAPDAPGGMVDFRRTVSLSFFFKFFLKVNSHLAEGLLNASELSLLEDHEWSEVSSGSQSFSTYPEKAPVGDPVVHVNSLKQVSGQAVYASDIPLMVGELHACYVYSTKAHAKILSIDAQPALSMAGVVDFITAKDIPGRNIGGMPHLPDELLFAENEVHAIGQVIGAVIAADAVTARLASRAVKIQYEELSATTQLRQAIEAKAFDSKPRTFKFGDPDAAWAQCDHVIEGEVSNGEQNHFYLETHSCVAYPGEDKEITIIAGVQGLADPTRTIAQILNIPINRIEMKVKRLGGAFGGKETRGTHPAATCAVAARKCKRPVRMVMDRDDNMVCFGNRHGFLTTYKIGFSKEGKIIAMEVNMYIDSGWHLDLSPEVLEVALWSVSSAYFVPNFRATGYVCRTNKVSGTAFRAFGRPQSALVAETMIEHIAAALGKDSLEIRKLNMIQVGQMVPTEQEVDVEMQRIWRDTLLQSKFDARLADRNTFNSANKWKKRGLSVVPLLFGLGITPKFLLQAGALVHILTDGSVMLYHHGIEMGNGISTKMVQIAAATLGVPVENVYNAETTTSTVNNSGNTCASVTTDVAGPAVLDACQQLRDRLAPIREKLGASATFAHVAEAAFEHRIDLTAHGYSKPYDLWFDWEKGEGVPLAYFVSAAACVSVEIDALTGAHSVLSTDIVLDVGESINPAIDIGQIEGAFMQGYGFYTLEEMVYDTKSGALLTRGPGNYKIPGFGDVPREFNVTLLKDSPNPKTIFSSRGVGEPPLILGVTVHTAIRDAIKAARIERGLPAWFPLDAPATCERIRMACEDEFTRIIRDN